MLTTEQLQTLKAAILAETAADFVAARTAGATGEMSASAHSLTVIGSLIGFLASVALGTGSLGGVRSPDSLFILPDACDNADPRASRDRSAARSAGVVEASDRGRAGTRWCPLSAPVGALAGHPPRRP